MGIINYKAILDEIAEREQRDRKTKFQVAMAVFIKIFYLKQEGMKQWIAWDDV
jgi:predicted transcriptional regulator